MSRGTSVIGDQCRQEKFRLGMQVDAPFRKSEHNSELLFFTNRIVDLVLGQFARIECNRASILHQDSTDGKLGSVGVDGYRLRRIKNG